MTQTPSRLDPRADRGSPRWAVAFSAGVVLASLGSLAVVLTGAQGTTKPWVALAFVGFAVLELPIYLAAMRRVLDGRPVPGWTRLVQVALVMAGFVVTGPAWDVGVAMLAGLFGAMFAANLWSIRVAPSGREWPEEDEAEAVLEPEALT